MVPAEADCGLLDFSRLSRVCTHFQALASHLFRVCASGRAASFERGKSRKQYGATNWAGASGVVLVHLHKYQIFVQGGGAVAADQIQSICVDPLLLFVLASVSSALHRNVQWLVLLRW